MRQERAFPAVTVTKKAESALRAGHPWVYAAEITGRRGDLSSGCITDVFSPHGAWLGAGFYSAEQNRRARPLRQRQRGLWGAVFRPPR